jgi:tRNA (guanine37-N1)-methyltransferase
MNEDSIPLFSFTTTAEMSNNTAIVHLHEKSSDHGDIQGECFVPSNFPDISWFDETVHHPAISVCVRQVAYLKKLLKSIMLQERKNVYIESMSNCDTINIDASKEQLSQRRILVMNVGVTHDDLRSLLSPNESVLCDNNYENDLTWIDSFPITRGYYDMSVEEVLRKLLPKNSVNEIPSSFELVGHIAHVNLRDDCLPYKYWIGRVLLDLNNPTIRTVVNKIGTIESDNIFRTFHQEVLAGNSKEPDWSVTTVYEYSCCFHLDFRHVYWNSRLSGEHHRLVQLIQKDFEKTMIPTNDHPKPNDTSFVVADLMAGVGPFAIPLTSTISSKEKTAASKVKSDPSLICTTKNTINFPPRITVYANDLNPTSYKYLKINAKKNKCVNLHCSNKDARAFLQELQEQVQQIDHVIMNLPASAPEFLDAFRRWKLEKLPMVHVHCFGIKTSENISKNQLIADRCMNALGCAIDDYKIIVVRNISPTKNMFCFSFQLPNEARCVKENIVNDSVPVLQTSNESHTKKQKL